MTRVTGEVIEAAAGVAAANGMDGAVLLAVAIVETDAVPFALVEGRSEPLIRFEGHYFDRRLTGETRSLARRRGLCDPRAGAVRNPASQAGRWRLYERAAALDAEAAAASVSWGLCQVMGAHFDALGFHSARDLAATAREGIGGQFEVAARFLTRGGLAARLGSGDLAGFARRYNGPAYRRNRYDDKIGQAFIEAKGLMANRETESGTGAPPRLRPGSRGQDVRRMQGGLVAGGAAIAVDGRFGPATRAALIRFQEACGLDPNGVGDAATLAALGPRGTAAWPSTTKR